MNYRHSYHAGNFADVLKHIVVIELLQALSRKNTPFCYIDTHAGCGYYDLLDTTAQKSKEYENGIEKIIQADNPPAVVKRYLDIIHDLNNKLTHAKFASLQYYPGSPMVARSILRPHDRMVACELHPDDYELLREAFLGDKQVAVHHTDGFLGLKAFLPPDERRGLILIDPPYENPDEFTRIVHSLPAALKRFANGIFAIWYPIKEKRKVEQFHQALEKLPYSSFIVELTIYPDLPNHFNGSGLAIINPPWQFAESIQEILPWLWNALSINGQGAYRAQALK